MPKLTAEELNSLGLKPETLPRHVAIVMDGNGRWAQQRGLPRSFGHRAGTERLREIIRFSSDAGVKALTLYAFSTENWRRPEEEKSVLFSLLIEYFNSEIDELHELFHCTKPSGVPRGPSQLHSIPDFSEAPLDLPEITGTSRGNQGFPAPTRKRPRESFFNAS